MIDNIQIISAPSNLGLKSDGIEKLGERLLICGLKEKLRSPYPVIDVPSLNSLRSHNRNIETHCLNAQAIARFSLDLSKVVSEVIERKRFAFILGGDCSILLGIMASLKARGAYGLIFIDAHADFYAPEKSTTGEVADMDLAIVTGRGPELLTNINGLRPYVWDNNVIHIGQRDEEQTKEYGSQDIRETAVACFSLERIQSEGLARVTKEVLQQMKKLEVDGFWIHFDTDVLADEINPAVDYRLPGGLQFGEASSLIHALLTTEDILGISVTIYNANLDTNGQIAKEITKCLSLAFNNSSGKVNET